MADATATPAVVRVGATVYDWQYGSVVDGDVTMSLPADVLVDAVLVPVDVPTAHVHVPFDTWRPRFSPDGQSLLVCRTNPGDHDTDLSSMQLWIFDANQLDQDEPTMVRGAPSDYGWTIYGHPEWAPDSESVVIYAEAGGFWEIHWLDSFTWDDLGAIHTVASPNMTYDPSYAPDGSVLCVDYIDTDGLYYIARITNLATPTYQQLLSSPNALADPMVSPDGTKIIYSEQTALPDMTHSLGKWALKVCAIDGNDSTDVLSDNNVHEHPTWQSPRYVVFQTFRYGTDSQPQVARIRTNGTGHMVLGEGEYPEAAKI